MRLPPLGWLLAASLVALGAAAAAYVGPSATLGAELKKGGVRSDG